MGEYVFKIRSKAAIKQSNNKLPLGTKFQIFIEINRRTKIGQLEVEELKLNNFQNTYRKQNGILTFFQFTYHHGIKSSSACMLIFSTISTFL